MATTAGGLPYVQSSDLVSGWPAVSQSLAEELDTQLAAKGDVAGETWTGTHDFSGATVNGIAAGLALVATASPSGASSVSIDNCFTSTYANYLIMVTLTCSVGSIHYMRLRASSSDNTSGIYGWGRNYVSFSGTNTATGGSAQTAFTTFYGDTETNANITVMAPQAATKTMFYAVGGNADNDCSYGGGNVNSAAQFDGFTLYPASGTISGTIRVYAYLNA